MMGLALCIAVAALVTVVLVLVWAVISMLKWYHRAIAEVLKNWPQRDAQIVNELVRRQTDNWNSAFAMGRDLGRRETAAEYNAVHVGVRADRTGVSKPQPKEPSPDLGPGERQVGVNPTF